MRNVRFAGLRTMDRRKKLLYLVHRVPFPPNRGDRIRTYHILCHLAERYDVSLATLADEPVPDEARREFDRLCVRTAIEPIGHLRWIRAAATLAGGRSATEGLFASPALARTVRGWAQDQQFDAAVVVCSSMVQYIEPPELRNTPAIIDLIDVDSQKWFDYAATARGAKKWLFTLDGRRLRRLERTLPDKVTGIALVSEAEAEIYRKLAPNEKTVAVPNGVDLDYFRTANDGRRPWKPLPLEDRCEAVFVGALDYRANVDAVTWFVAEVWPLVLRRLAHLRLALVGRRPDSCVRRLASVAGIRLFADVPDVRPHIAAAAFTIAPLRVARGIQNKVLESMAMGRPAIVSPAAWEGIGTRIDPPVIIAEDPREWVTAIDCLLADEQRTSLLKDSSRQFVEQRHTWSAACIPLDKVLATLADDLQHEWMLTKSA
jgi:sugar transferase (PEP-CTERM/EpsH1 system associated)